MTIWESHAWNVTGRVVDTDGAPIAYARVYAKGTTFGAISQEDGQYSLRLPGGMYELLVTHESHQPYRQTLIINSDTQLDITLSVRVRNLDSVEIRAGKKDPAYAIIKQMIEHKKAYKQQFTTYRAKTYHKNTLRADTLPKANDPEMTGVKSGMDAFVESRSTVFFEAPNKYKTVVDAYRNLTPGKGTDGIQISFGAEGGGGVTEAGNPYLFYQDVAEANFNFYDNLMLAEGLSDRQLVSPLHSTLWQLSYRYHLDSTYLQDGKVHYRISIKPRNSQGPYFTGSFVVVDREWAFRSISVSLPSNTMPFFKAFEINHRYEPYGDGRWLLGEETYTYKINEGRIRYKGVAQVVYQDYELDVEHPKRFFQNETRRMEADALEKDSTYWIDNRLVNLNEQEAIFAQKRDSAIAYHSSIEYLQEQDSIYNHIGVWDILLNGTTWRNRVKQMEYYINPVIAQVVPLGIGGYRHNLEWSVKKTFRRGKAIRVSPNINYGVANQDIRGGATIWYGYNPHRFARFFVKGGNVYTMINQWATLANIFSRGNFINKIYVGGGNGIELVNGLQFDLNFDFADYRAIDELELAAWSEELFGENNQPRSFENFREFLIEVKLRYTPGQRYQTEPYRKLVLGSKWPTFTLKYKKAIPGFFNSSIDYDYVGLDVKHKIRPGGLGIADWTFSFGTFVNQRNLMFTDYNFFRGGDPFLLVAPLSEFQLLGPTLSTPNEFLEGHYYHDFQGSLIDQIPLLKLLPIQVSAGAGTLYIRDQNLLHNEIFAGINVPLRIKRQRFKIGAFYATSYTNNEQAVSSGFKFGVSFYNNVKRQWEY